MSFSTGPGHTWRSAGTGGLLGGILRPRGLVVPRHRATTRHLPSLYPCQTEPGLGPEGVLLGVDELAGGAAFCFDPFTLYTNGRLENPNMLIVGEPGFGKSAAVKCFLYRTIGTLGAPGPPGTPTAGGRWVAVCDPKGEYQPLAEALGLQMVRLYPGGPDRVNPLDAGPSVADNPAELTMRRTAMVYALVTAVLKRSLTPVEEAGIAGAIAQLDPETKTGESGQPTLMDVSRLLGSPNDRMAIEAGIDAERLAEECASARLGLGRLISRDLRGMFDGPSTVRIDWTGRGLVLDVSSVHHDPDALSVVMIPATSWLQALMADSRPDAPRKVQVIEECWAMLRHERVAFYLQSCWKLCRRYGVANIAVAHRLSDLRSQADDGTATAKVAMGLLADTQTRVIFRQSAGQVAEAKELLGLSDVAAALLPQLPKGAALWKIGELDALVRHTISPTEAAICNTDGQMNVT
jgi:type IV secretory pathway VirB4 component